MSKDFFETLRFPLMPKINNTNGNYRLHLKELTTIALKRFKYIGLPTTLPAQEIELRLINQGFAPVFQLDKFGIVTSYGSMFGQDQYFHSTHVTYTQPVLGSNQLEVGKDVAVIFDSTLSSYLSPVTLSGEIISWFARLLADIDTTIAVSIINNRMTRGVVTKTSTAFDSYKNYLKDLEAGELSSAFTATGIIDGLQQILSHDIKETSLESLLSCKQNIQKLFYNLYGFQFIMHKAERLIPDEIVNDTEYLSSFVIDLLESRQQGIAEVNAMWGLESEVVLNNEII